MERSRRILLRGVAPVRRRSTLRRESPPTSMVSVAVTVLACLVSPAHPWFASSSNLKELTWSPDSRQLCFTEYCELNEGQNDGGNPTGDDFIVCVTVDSPVTVRVLLPTSPRIHPSNSGNQVALAGESGVFTLDLTEGRLTSVAKPALAVYPERRVGCLSWSPSDERIACFVQDCRGRDELAVADLVTGHISEMEETAWVRSIRWLNDTSLILSLEPRPGRDTPYVRVDLATGARQQVSVADYLGGQDRPVVVDTVLESALLLKFPDGRFQSVSLPMHMGPVRVRNGELSPDGKAVAFQSARVDRYDLRKWIWDCIAIDDTAIPSPECARLSLSCTGRPHWLPGRRLLFLTLAPPSYCILEPDGRCIVMTVSRDSISALQVAPDSMNFSFEVHEDGEVSLGVARVDTPGFRQIRGAHSAQWFSGERALLCRRQNEYLVLSSDGTELRRIPLAFFGYKPQWVADSVILFRAGYGRREYTERTMVYPASTMRYFSNDPVWQVNPISGRMKRAFEPSVSTYMLYEPAPVGTRIPSPDGRQVAWIERCATDRRGLMRSWIWVADTNGSHKRMLVSSPGNFGELAEPELRVVPRDGAAAALTDTPSVTISGQISGRGRVRCGLPKWPAWAIRNRVRGTVVVELSVAPNGKVRSNLTIERPSGYPTLDEIVTDALREWQFAPLGSRVPQVDQRGRIVVTIILG